MSNAKKWLNENEWPNQPIDSDAYSHYTTLDILMEEYAKHYMKEKLEDIGSKIQKKQVYMSQIIFHGCSWTWGSGLQYYYLKEKHDYSIEKMNNFLPHEVRLEYFSRKVDDYRKKHHFPNLVSEHFDVPYLLAREGNGGDNHSICKNIKNAENYEHNSVYAHIVQLSAPMRGPDSPILQDKDAGISDIIRFQVEKVLEGVKNRMFPQPAAPVFFICWFKEHADYILNEYPDKLIYILA